MALLVPNVGEERALKAILNHTAPQDLTLKLYTSNTTPAESDVAATFTEASGFGYVSKSLSGPSWTVTAGDPTVATFAQQTWVFSGAAFFWVLILFALTLSDYMSRGWLDVAGK